MKFYSTSTLLLPILSLLSGSPSSVSAANRHAGTRRQLDLNNHAHHQHAKRAPLVPTLEVGPKMRAVKRHGNAFIAKREANPSPYASYGAVPVMDIGTAPMIGLVGKKRDIPLNFAHNGQQGAPADSSNNTDAASFRKNHKGDSSSSSSSDTSSSSSNSNSVNSSGDDDEDDEDCEEEEDDSLSFGDDDDDEDCDEDDDDDDDDEEDCDEDEDDDDSSSSSSSSDGSLLDVKVNVNAKQASPSSSSSSSSSSASPSSSQSNGSSSSSGKSDSKTGTATWYEQKGVAGACGKVNPENAKIIALYTSAYAGGANCGRTVQINNLDDGTSTTAVVADMCPSCGGENDIDLSIGAFEAIDPQYRQHGIRKIEWWFTD